MTAAAMPAISANPVASSVASPSAFCAAWLLAWNVAICSLSARPVGCTPICAVLQALAHGSSVQTCGSAIMPPPVISESGFTEFTSIT